MGLKRIAVSTGVVTLAVLGATCGRSGGPETKGDKRTTVTVFEDDGGSCSLDSKESTIRVDRGRAVQWLMDNQCSTAYTFSVGNFRKSKDTNATDCKAPGPDIPFRNADDEARRTVDVGAGANQVLTLADAQKPGSGKLVLYYDICRSNPSGTTKLDPRLVVE